MTFCLSSAQLKQLFDLLNQLLNYFTALISTSNVYDHDYILHVPDTINIWVQGCGGGITFKQAFASNSEPSRASDYPIYWQC